jgi:peptide/nickel transport system substrate-binding protein
MRVRVFLALLMIAVVGCSQPAPPAATTAPKPAEAAKPTEAPKPAEAAKPAAAAPTTAPAAAAPTAAPAAKPAEAAKPATPVGNKQLVIGLTMNDFKTFDPGRLYEIYPGMAQYAMYEPLLQFEGADIITPRPNLATEWKISPDGKTYTFTIRDGVKFTSGNPLTSADFKFAFDRIKNLKGQPSFLANKIAEVQAPDPKTLVVILSDVDPAFLGRLGQVQFAAYDSKLAKEQGAVSEPGADQSDKAEEWFLTHSAGSGPYLMKEYVPKDRMVLERNPNYWGTPAKADRIILQNMPDPAAQKLTLEKGDLDLALDLTTDQTKALDAGKGAKVYTAQSLIQLFAYFNEDPAVGGPLANVDVQRAIRYAIDYDGLAELVGGGAIKLPSIIQLGFLGALGPDAQFKTDIDKAKELMAKAGFASGFKIDHETAATAKTGGVAHLLLAQKLQTDLAKIGITTNIVVQDDATSLDRYRKALSPLGARGWGPDYPDAINQFAFCPGSQVGLRMNWKAEMAQDIADLCKKASSELDEAKRADMIKQIQLAMMDRGPYANLIQPGVQYGYRQNVDGVVYNPVYQLALAKIDKK